MLRLIATLLDIKVRNTNDRIVLALGVIAYAAFILLIRSA